LRRFATALTAVMAGTAAPAATAQAQAISITPAKACYLTGEKVSLSGSGFTAGGGVAVTLDGRSLGDPLTADGAGNIAAEVGFGTMRGVKTHALTATDTGNPALTSTASFVGTTLRVTVKPANATAGRKLRVRGQGLLAADGSLAGRNVFMHVRGPGGYKADRRVSRLKAPCGSFAARKRIVEPDAANGVYRVQFDAARKFSKKTRPRFPGEMTVYTRPASAGARASLFGGAELARRWTSLSG
jgi:hypothetical protein